MTDIQKPDLDEQALDADLALLDESEGMSVEPLTQWKLFRARFSRHRLALFGTVALLLISSLALFAPALGLLPPETPLSNVAPAQIAQVEAALGRSVQAGETIPQLEALTGIDISSRALNLEPPGKTVSGIVAGNEWIGQRTLWMGTDELGQDQLSRVIYGGRTSLRVGVLTGLIVASLGTLVGAVAGYYGGWIETVLMRFTDLMLSLPLLPVAIAAAVWFREIFKGNEAVALALLLGILTWGTLARIVRAEFLSLREKEFVESARASGARDRRIIFRHVLPNALSPIIVNATLVIGGAIIIEAALSFLGFGVTPPTPAWGQMTASGGRLAVTGARAWWLVVFPGLALISTVLSVNYIGDGLRDALDPSQTIERK